MDKEVRATPAWPERIIAQLDNADLRAQTLAQNLTNEQLNWRPSPQEWSIGQCLQHLVEFNREYGAAISRALDGEHPSPVGELKIGRVSSPKKIKPDTQISPSVLNDFLRSNQQAKDLVRRAAAFNVNRIRYKNPLAPLVRFTVGVGFELTWKHELRHILQAERVRQSPEFPSSL
jgi:hypothetical protein